jgi:hypothetical protein
VTVRSSREYFQTSLTRLKQEIAEIAGPILDQSEEKIARHHKEEQCGLWQRLNALFRVIDKGSQELNCSAL